MIRSLFLALFFVLSHVACKNQPPKETALLNMVRDSTVMGNVHAYIDSLWNRQDTTFLKNLSSEHFKRNLNGIEVANTPREMQAHLNVFFTAFPDLKLSLEQAFVQDGKAFILWSTKGTNTGIFGEMAPTGKKVKINGMSHLYFDEEGKLYGEYVYFNELELLQQLGYTLLPPNLE